MTATSNYKKKLIEVALPLEVINAASAREKNIRHGHPSTLHLWWARRPLAAGRAILFAQLVDDPSSHPERFPTHEDQDAERKRLFSVMAELVRWESSANEEVLDRARQEIRASCGDTLPSIFDPFSGGGTIPLEAQRLGLPAYGSDLNPVAVTIGKAMVEIPPLFANVPPIHPGPKEQQFYNNAQGLSEDVRFYGNMLKDKAWERLEAFYPEVGLSEDLGGGTATVVAWIWSRTVPSPDPAFSDTHVPIASSFLLSQMKGREAWVEPIVDQSKRSITFRVSHNDDSILIARAKQGTKAGRGANFTCLLSGAAITPAYVKEHASNGRMGQALIAIVAEGRSGRLYLSPQPEHERIACSAKPTWIPEQRQPDNPRWFSPPSYGMETFGSLFTQRQLLALGTFSELIEEVRSVAETQALRAGMSSSPTPLRERGSGAHAYAEAIGVYLSFLVSKLADKGSTLCTWDAGPASNRTESGRSARVATVRVTFGRQALAMSWDFAEVNFFSSSVGALDTVLKTLSTPLLYLPPNASVGSVLQQDAQNASLPPNAVVSTDPPYYDNIGYSDLSDFFYCWLRPSLRSTYPDLYGILATPKSEELVASPYRHNGTDSAERFFLEGMTTTIRNLATKSSERFPATIYYAFKQSEVSQEGVSSTGWATFLQAVISAGYSVVATWPVRTEMASRMVASGTNALANSVVLVCRKRPTDADAVTRAEFVRSLKRELPAALKELLNANIAPADMPQSAIGPGIGVFSRYRAVLESDDSPMTMKTALQIINRELDEYLGGIQGEFDPETRFAITWFEQNGMNGGEYGVANNIATARGISVEGVKHAGIVYSEAGRVRILRRDELSESWEPESDAHLTIWECLQYLVRIHEKDGISQATTQLMKKIEPYADAVRDLAYCLYDLSANKRNDAKEATAYNALIADWAELSKQAASLRVLNAPTQLEI